MKHRYLLALALALTSQANAADKDSIYSWGAWTQNIQPAAGPALRVAAAPVLPTQVNFRPNENSAFNRTTTPATPIGPTAPAITPPPVEVVITLPTPAPAVIPDAPQLPNIVIAPSSTPSSAIGDL